MKKNIISIVLVAVFSISFITAALITPAAAAEKPITIEYVSFVGQNHLMINISRATFDEIEKRSDGRLKFVYKGGPEAIAIFDQAMAVYRGATDMVLTTPSFMGKLVKGLDALSLSMISPAKYREAGLYDYINSLVNKKANMQYLRTFPRAPGTAFVFLSKKEVESPDDFKGMTIRGGDEMDIVAPKFGMKTAATQYHEEYSALERGILDMGRMTIESMVGFKLWEVGNYLIQPSFCTVPGSWFMNLDKWNSIPDDLQALIVDTLYERAPQDQKKADETIASMEQKMYEHGVKKVEFTGKEREEFLSKIYDGYYEYYMDDSPEVTEKIYEMTRKR
ncbi:MAG: TRAP transporter substrate-binding protein DctP [Desulfobacteraceae bacterium]|nr:TRAP transporter substrate-binding protein DctP [Desulfobacteraceae bacterium]